MNVEQQVVDFADNGASPEKNMIPDAVVNAARAGLTLGENLAARTLWMNNELLSQRMTVSQLGQERRRVVELSEEPVQAFDGEMKSILFKRQLGGLPVRIPRNMPSGNANSSCIFVCLDCYIHETYERVCVPWSYFYDKGTDTRVYVSSFISRKTEDLRQGDTHVYMSRVYI
jgi:hypothetical protein